MSFIRTIILSVLSAALVCHAGTEDDKLNLVNPPASLKPQTPIVGTNLVLNTPYKWHDRLRPGCYATKLEIYNSIYIVCTKDDQQWYDTHEASWIFERAQGPESTNEYNGQVIIRNVGSKSFIRTSGFPVYLYLILTTLSSHSYDYWNIRTDPKDKNNLQFELQNYWLRQVSYPEPHRSVLAIELNAPANYPYSFASDIQLHGRMYNFEFEEPSEGEIERLTSQMDLIDAYDINNDSPASVSRTITVSEKITNEYSWGFSESLKILAKITGSVGIPFLAEGKIETQFDFTVTANQNWKSSEEKTFSMSYVVNVPPHTIVKVSAWYDLTKGISMNYTAETEITGKGKRITVFDDVVEDAPVTGELIRQHLEYAKFDGKIVQIKEFSVITRITGTMVATVGVRGQLNVNGKSVVNQDLPK